MLLFSFLLPFLTLVSCDFVPVTIWGNYGVLEDTQKPHGFEFLENEFASILRSLTTKRPHILLFLEQNLSIEDFRDGTFANLQNSSKSSKGFLYMHSVERPINVIHKLTNHGYSIEKFDQDAPPALANPTILTVNLREPRADEPREAFLRAHDDDMALISEQAVRLYGRVLAIYTGRHASFVAAFPRYKREAEEEEAAPSNDIIMTDSDKMIVVVTGSPIVLRQNNNVTNLTQAIYASTETKKKQYIALDVKFKEEEISLDLIFDSPSENHAWTLETIKIENWEVELRSRTKISAPAGYSYFCAQDIIFTGTKDGIEYSVTLKGLQAQPRVSNNIFGPASDCIPYFSEPIWSGIMIMTLLIVVAMTAILMILDIHANDKFDDPKGKVITISNAE